MKRSILLSLIFAVSLSLIVASQATAAILYESGTLGPTGVPQGSVAATNINPFVFTGVRFELTKPVITSQVGGHFVSQTGGTFFGAIIALTDENDFPDSVDFTTPDFVGSTVLDFPALSEEVFGNLDLTLEPGWYALVFGSGLFNTSGDGAAPRNNTDIGNPEYIAFQSGSVFGWVNITTFPNHRFVVQGNIVPEPTTILLMAIIFSVLFTRKVSIV